MIVIYKHRGIKQAENIYILAYWYVKLKDKDMLSEITLSILRGAAAEKLS